MSNYLQYNELGEPVVGGIDVEDIPQAAQDKSYEHIQRTASTLWTINHNLNKFPSVSCFRDGAMMVGDVVYIDANNLTVTFTVANRGTALLN